VLDGIAFNRRGVTRDGSICMPWPVGHRQEPLGPTHLRYMEGPTDPEVGVLCVRTEDLRMVAMLMHFTCHPVNVFGNRHTFHAVSADWPGAWTAGMREVYGAGCVPLVIDGCCGNIIPWDPFDTDFVPDHRRMGAALTEMGRQVVASIEFSDSHALDCRLRKVPLAYRPVPQERLDEVERILSQCDGPKWRENRAEGVDPEWFHAASTRSIEYCRKRMPEFLYEVQALRVGDVGFIGLPGEPFVEGQLAIKIQSPAYPTYVAHCTSHYVGYLPTREASTRGGHEANERYTFWAKLATGSLETVTENAVEMLREIFPAAPEETK